MWAPESFVPRVLIRHEMLCVLQETICRKRSWPGTRASSLIPIAYIFPKPNSLPCARKPLGPESFS